MNPPGLRRIDWIVTSSSNGFWSTEGNWTAPVTPTRHRVSTSDSRITWSAWLVAIRLWESSNQQRRLRCSRPGVSSSRRRKRGPPLSLRCFTVSSFDTSVETTGLGWPQFDLKQRRKLTIVDSGFYEICLKRPKYRYGSVTPLMHFNFQAVIQA